MALVEQGLGLYRERSFDLKVRRFLEKLCEEHGVELSYTSVKLALQGAGLVAKARKRGVHSPRRGRRPCRVCCCTSMAATPVVSG